MPSDKNGAVFPLVYSESMETQRMFVTLNLIVVKTVAFCQMRVDPQLACVAGVQRGGRGKLNASAKRDESAKRDRWALVGNACRDAIVFFVFYVHQMDAKILIGQNSLEVLNLLFWFVRYMSFSIYVISIYTAGVRRSLLLATYTRNVSFIGRANRSKIRVRCVAKNNCSKEMIYKPFFRQAMESRNFT